MKVCLRIVHGGRTDDALRARLESASATHLMCCLRWNYIYCSHPWLLKAKVTYLVKRNMNDSESGQVWRWAREVGSKGPFPYLEAEESFPWRIDVPFSGRVLRRSARLNA